MLARESARATHPKRPKPSSESVSIVFVGLSHSMPSSVLESPQVVEILLFKIFHLLVHGSFVENPAIYCFTEPCKRHVDLLKRAEL